MKNHRLLLSLCALFLIIDLSPAIAQDSLVSIVGTGTSGYAGAGGPAAQAQLSTPNGIGHDAAGNMYIAEAGNNRIRKVDAVTGIITTVVDTSGAPGYSGDNGPAISAAIHSPIGIFVDGPGNIYFCDSYNHCVRKVSAATGIITTIAGRGHYGYGGDNGLADSAYLNTPAGVFVTANGDAYITDGGNNVIRKVTASSGLITTVAGNGTNSYGGDNGPATQAYLSLTAGKCFVDDANNIYIPDDNNCVVRKVTAATGNITTVAGNHSLAGHFSGDSGLATDAGMFHVNGIWVDAAGNMYVSDGDNHRVRKVDITTGIIHTIAGGGTGAYDGTASLAVGKHIYYIWDMWPDSVGNMLMADYGWGVIWKLIPCVSNMVTKSNTTLSAADKGATYQWLDCNNGKTPVPGATRKDYTGATAGNYAVQVTKNGCVDTSACFTYYPTGINEVSIQSGLRISPNPATAQISISLEQTMDNTTIRIYDLLGQMIMENTDISGSRMSIDISKLTLGNYLVEVVSGGNILRSRFVRE